MEQLDLSTYALEKRAGLKPSAVQNIIYGRSKNPSIGLIKSIAKALECNIEELLASDNQANHSPDLEKGSFNSSLTENFSKIKGQWNQQLYLSCFKMVQELLEKRRAVLAKNIILDLVDQVYDFSHGHEVQEPDEYFANWLMDKYIN